MKFKLKLQHFHTSQWTRTRQSLSTFDSRDMCVPVRIYKSAFYSYNFHIFRLFGFGKEGDVYRFMITMGFCHDHQRCVMHVLSYVSVVVDFLQTIIWKSLFAAVGAR